MQPRDPGLECCKEKLYRKFSNKGAGRPGKPLGGTLIRWGIFPASRGFLQNENRTIFGLDMAKNVHKPMKFGVKKEGAPLMENLR